MPINSSSEGAGSDEEKDVNKGAAKG